MRKTLAGLLTLCLGLPTATVARQSAATTSLAATSLTTVDSQDAAGTVRDVVRKLGVGKKIRLRTVTDEEVRGRITSIGDETFAVDAGQQRVISYADVRALKRQGMNGWVKGGIIAGAGFGILLLIAGLAVATQY